MVAGVNRINRSLRLQMYYLTREEGRREERDGERRNKGTEGNAAEVKNGR